MNRKEITVSEWEEWCRSELQTISNDRGTHHGKVAFNLLGSMPDLSAMEKECARLIGLTPMDRDPIYAAVRELYLARKARDEAKAKHRARVAAIREEHGYICDREGETDEVGAPRPRCLLRPPLNGYNDSDWCPKCDELHRFWKAYQAATKRAGTVLRKVMRLGRELVEAKS